MRRRNARVWDEVKLAVKWIVSIRAMAISRQCTGYFVSLFIFQYPAGASGIQGGDDVVSLHGINQLAGSKEAYAELFLNERNGAISRFHDSSYGTWIQVVIIFGQDRA